eukprot:5847615-Amphidinium_carterae.1
MPSVQHCEDHIVNLLSETCDAYTCTLPRRIQAHWFLCLRILRRRGSQFYASPLMGSCCLVFEVAVVATPIEIAGLWALTALARKQYIALMSAAAPMAKSPSPADAPVD